MDAQVAAAAAITDQQRAAQLALEMRGEVVLSPEDLEAIWYLLQRHALESPAGELAINYDDFSQVAAECRELLGPHTDTYFQASVFLRLARDEGGCASLPALFHYLGARSRQLQLRVQLGSVDLNCTGSLTLEQLRQLLQRLCPAQSALSAAGVKQQEDWVLVAASRVWLAHSKRGRASVKDLACSPLMHELVQATQLLPGGASAAAVTPGLLPGSSSGWFLPANVARLRRLFAELDADGDGQISSEEFASFGEGTLTPLFIQRIFAQHCSGGGNSSSGSGSNCTSGGGNSSNGTSCCGGSGSGKSSSNGSSSGGGGTKARGGRRGMDFASFATFGAAWEDRGHPGAVKYFFQVLDLQGRGFLDQVDLYTLFKEVWQLWVELGQYPDLRMEDMVVELTDLLRPANPHHITAADFERSGAAGTVVGLLADVNLFWEYENREALAQQAQQE